jgi:hypothetical protein
MVDFKRYQPPFKESRLIGSARGNTLRESYTAIRKAKKISYSLSPFRFWFLFVFSFGFYLVFFFFFFPFVSSLFQEESVEKEVDEGLFEGLFHSSIFCLSLLSPLPPHDLQDEG